MNWDWNNSSYTDVRLPQEGDPGLIQPSKVLPFFPRKKLPFKFFLKKSADDKTAHRAGPTQQSHLQASWLHFKPPKGFIEVISIF